MNTMKRTRWILAVICAASLLPTALRSAQRNETPEVLLQRGIQREIVDGDLQAAIDLYKKVVSTSGVKPAVAAQALIHLGEIYEKLGDAEARKTYERVVRDYGKQTQAVAEAQAHLKAMAVAPASRPSAFKGLTRLASGSWNNMAVTPDGRYLMLMLEIHDLATGRVSPTLEGLTIPDDPHPFPSPDGKQVVYFWQNPGDGTPEMRISPVGAKAAQGKLLLRSEEFDHSNPFGWSPDGKEVFTILGRKDQTNVIAAISTANGSLRIVKSLEWRYPGGVPNLSPDGRYIAYDVQVSKDAPAKHDIFVLATDGSGEVAIAQDGSDSSPLWTPDGQALVFESARAGAMGLWRIQIVDGKPRGAAESLRPNTDVDPIGFTRDGAFYYQTRSAPNIDIYTAEIDLATGTVIRPAERAIQRFPGHNSSPAYSPDGKSLAYLSWRTNRSVPSIVIRTLASGEEREITTALAIPQDRAGNPVLGPPSLTWLPDGGPSLLVAEPSAGELFLHRIDLKTGEDSVRGRIRSNFFSPAAAPDGKRIYYIKNSDGGNDQVLVAFDFETQRETELFKGAIPARGGGRPVALSPMRPALSPDGRQIAFVLTEKRAATLTNPNGVNTDPVVAVVPSAGGPYKKLLSSESSQWRVIRWSPDGKKVLAQRGNGQLWWLSADGGAPERIGTGNVPAIESMHPDGKQIANNRVEAGPPGEVWVDPDLLRPTLNVQPQARRDETGEMYLVPIDSVAGKVSGQAVRVAEKSSGLDCAPAWSPDGRSIAFKRPVVNANGQSQYHWVIRSVDTGNEKVYTALPGMARIYRACSIAPIWFHDGQSLLMGSVLTYNTPFPIRTNVNTGQAQPIRGAGSADAAVALSSDDKTLYVTDTNDVKEKTISIVSIDLASGAQKRIWVAPFKGLDLGDLLPLRLALSPDGRTLALVLSDDKKSHLIRVGVDGNGYQDLLSAEGVGCSPAARETKTCRNDKAPVSAAGAAFSRSGLAWSKDGRSILFMDSDKSGQRLMRIAADGRGKPEFMGLVIPDHDTDVVLDLSPDGRRLVFFSPGAPIVSSAVSR